MQVHKRIIICIFVISQLQVLGCASVSEPHIPDIHRQENRSSDYPVGIVPANFKPESGLDLIIGGKTSGASTGAAAGIVTCTELLEMGEYGAVAFILCAPFGALVGGVTGAVTSPSADEVKTAEEKIYQQILPLADQAWLAQSIRNYLSEEQDKPGISIAEELQRTATAKQTENLELEPADLGRYRTILEVATLEIVFKGSGRKNKPVCFVMKARATKWDGYSGEKLDTMEPVYQGACAPVDEWINGGSKRIIDEIETGYQVLTEEIVDELYLVFIPGIDESLFSADSERMFPYFVLKPVQPALKGEKKDFFAPITKWHVTETDDLSPTFSWEPFPRPFDLFNQEALEPEDISYELRIYGPWEGWSLYSPKINHVHTAKNIQQNHYTYPGDLKPCSVYFWTVRAHFKLGDVARVTEWGGRYGSHFQTPSSPSDIRRSIYSMWTEDTRLFSYYYPFSTPADPANQDCRKEK